MNLEYFIAKKVAASGQKSFSRLIIRIAVASIAISVAVMIIATALIRGFKNEISTKIFGFWGHIHITDISINRSFEEKPINKNQDFVRRLDTIHQVTYLDSRNDNTALQQYKTKGGVRHTQIFATAKGIIKTKDAIMEGVILKGIWNDFDWTFFEQYLQEGRRLNLPDSTASKEILISRSTASRLKLGVGDRFLMHFVGKEKQLLRRRFEVCGIYKTGLEEYDKIFAIADLRQIQRLRNWNEDEITGFEVFIDQIDDLEIINDYIYTEELPKNLYSESIKDKFPGIFEWLELQNVNEVVIIILLLLVSIINMITALMILILERTNMIGILKALGQSDWNIRKIFLYYAGYIIAWGLLVGNLLGIGLCYIQKHFELIKLQEEDYYLAVAPIHLDYGVILLLNLGALCIILLFLVLPSYLVTSISPVKAIRFK